MANPEFSISTIDAISGLQLVEYDCGTDHRGDIYSTFHADSLSDLNLSFVQDKFSRSKKNVLRGFHGDEKSTKLVCCVFGAVLQVVYDARLKARLSVRRTLEYFLIVCITRSAAYGPQCLFGAYRARRLSLQICICR